MNYIGQLRLVEIELFSYCNRKCKWCPNREIDRTHNIYIENNVLESLILELSKYNYNGAITFSRYNEPLSHIDFLKDKLSYIKSILPNCKLITNTNGDYVTKDNLDGLLIDELTIMDYDNLGIEKCSDKLLQCGVIIDKIYKNYIYAHKDDMLILYYTNWRYHRNITDRGGFLKEYSMDNPRQFQCLEPTYFVGINYDGTVSPCCNIRNDVCITKPYIMGDLHHNSLESILNSYQYNQFRDMCSLGVFFKDSPCYTCSNTGGRYTRGNGGISYE